MATFFVNPMLFFLLEKDGVLAWDYKNHHQYLLNPDYFATLLEIAKKGTAKNKKIIKDLKIHGLISHKKHKILKWGWDRLAHIFHIGTQNIHEGLAVNKSQEEIATNYLADSSLLANRKTLPALFLAREGRTYSLPQPDMQSLKDISFYDAIQQRKTSRVFNSNFITLQALSTLLFTAFGLFHGDCWPDFKVADLNTLGFRKTSPASGALHAEEVYLCVFRVLDLDPGIYHYNVKEHQLTQIKNGDFEEQVLTANYQQFFSKGLACGFYLTCRFDKLWWKYKHSRAYKGTLLDVGHVSQTFLLTATALRLNTWITAAFHDNMVHDIIAVDGTIESAILFLGIGLGENHSIPADVLKLTQNKIDS